MKHEEMLEQCELIATYLREKKEIEAQQPILNLIKKLGLTKGYMSIDQYILGIENKN